MFAEFSRLVQHFRLAPVVKDKGKSEGECEGKDKRNGKGIKDKVEVMVTEKQKRLN